MSEETKPVKKAKVTKAPAKVEMPIVEVDSAKVLEIQGVGCVINLCGSSVFVPGVRLLGGVLVANKR